MESKIIQTSDGSHTIYVSAIDESYHSTHGAIQESMHVFIQAALQSCALQSVRILEVGFGTGLNAFLANIEADASNRKISYTSLEKYPLSLELLNQLNFSTCMASQLDTDFFEKMHLAVWNETALLSPNFELKKIECDFTLFESENEQFDVVFFDAFSPDKQAEMWTVDQFRKIYAWCAPGAILTTYCAKGVVRRALKEVGFLVERLPGPPGKREMIRAVKR